MKTRNLRNLVAAGLASLVLASTPGCYNTSNSARIGNYVIPDQIVESYYQDGKLIKRKLSLIESINDRFRDPLLDKEVFGGWMDSLTKRGKIKSYDIHVDSELTIYTKEGEVVYIDKNFLDK